MLTTQHITKWVNSSGRRVFLLRDCRRTNGKPQLETRRRNLRIFTTLNKEEGMTIIQVTHLEKNAAYGNLIIELLDGMIVK